METETFAVEEAARLCRVTADTVRRWIDKEGLPVSPVGPSARIRREDLSAFLSFHTLWAPPELASPGPRVLVVDDEANMRSLISRVVRRLDPAAQVAESSDGFDAGQKVMTLEPDVIILDLHLPGLEGVQVCRTLRASAGFKKVRVLAISGDKDPSLREAVLKEGADAFLGKPFYPVDLETALRDLLPAR